MRDCLIQNIALANGVLQPTILQAILNLFDRGNNRMTARMVKDECIVINNAQNWNMRLPAICNAMRNAINCGGRIVSENRDFMGFEIEFLFESTNGVSEVSTKDDTPIPAKDNISKLNYHLIIICASRKNENSRIYHNEIELKIKAISDPQNNIFHPDYVIDEEEGFSIRDIVLQSQNNQNLAPSYQLYSHPIYTDLFEYLGDRLFIQSAGWGIISSNFRLPYYNITFNQNANLNEIRANDADYKDFNHLENADNKEKLVFVGSIDYIHQFWQLVEELPNDKVIFHKNVNLPQDFPQIPARFFRYYETNARTNWHYQLARSIVNGEIIP